MVVELPRDSVVKFEAIPLVPAPDFVELPYKFRDLLPFFRQQYVRQRLFFNALIGKGLDGVDYGNLACKVGDFTLVTATQTSGRPLVTEKNYSLVFKWDISANRVWYISRDRPSSEVMSHLALPDPFTIHIHDERLFDAAEISGLPSTEPEVAYGTPEMAINLACLSRKPNQGIYRMSGHRPGLMIAGATALQAYSRLLLFDRRVRQRQLIYNP